MALHTALSLDQPVRAVLSFSGALIPPAQPWSKPPVALIHGDLDQLVPTRLSNDAKAALEVAGVETELFIEQGMSHGIAPDGIGFASRFLGQHLPVKA